jgi:hypothetical protein
MATQPIDITTLRFEAKDAEIFTIPDTQTRLDTLQNYFFPRLEVLLHDTVAAIQRIYGVNPYERMTTTARPQHRRIAKDTWDYGEVYMGLTGRRSTHPLRVRRQDGAPFQYHPSRLTYTVSPAGELQVVFSPFSQVVDAPFQTAVATLLQEHQAVLAPVLALYHVSQTCVRAGAFLDLGDAFGPEALRVTDQRPELVSLPMHFPLDANMWAWEVLQGAFIILYPLLEACVDLALGTPLQLMRRMDTFKAWYQQQAQKLDEADAEGDGAGEPDGVTDPTAIRPDLDGYTTIRSSEWWAVLARDQWTCCSCGRSSRRDGVVLNVDHIIPRSLGGTNAMDNLQTLCRKCNQGKSNRDSTDLRRASATRVQGEEAH